MKKILKFACLFLYCLALFLVLNSCASNCTKTKRYWNKHRCVQNNNVNYNYG